MKKYFMIGLMMIVLASCFVGCGESDVELDLVFPCGYELHLNAKQSELKKLRDSGVTTKEVILSTFLAFKSGHNAFAYYASVAKGRRTWDTHLNSIGITANLVGTEINRIIK